MTVTPLMWILAVALVLALVCFDFFFHVRKAHAPTLREAAIWSSLYVGTALMFGVGVLAYGGREPGTEYFAGYATEKALSVDNVFVFLVIMTSFKVPREDQQKALLFGIVFSLIARTALILVGAALISRFSWVFYAFGLILLVAAGNLLAPHAAGDDPGDNLVVRIARKLFRTTDHYDGDRLFTRHQGRRAMTPMLLVIAVIAGTDVLFALDSIPAIFGLTESAFIVFTATAFSLLGLRQLYFLIDGLLDRLLYLPYGLAVILGLIGVKLILHALHGNGLPFINEGRPVDVIEIGSGQSLALILAILIVTVAVSLCSPKGRTKAIVSALRRDVAEYLALPMSAAAARREELHARIASRTRQVEALPAALRALIRNPVQLRADVARVQALHGQLAAVRT
ncbi:MAG: transporter [Lysobacterales bacterium 69-70]|nr:TerC family protein [Xanthomonadaceae bacterium]ODU33103.1 MAG: transporter [Xanthomonadaceae bacterium SCN 69-320]ODV20569.1 MAG: transporter [Xanthomonadaceae bacterium SCN 69-25]OJZ00649.1 MAG: transporter [Xanthomonadales bacterium 69-70]